ncbi:MAG TPA: hypothetical protein VFS75_02415 [Candidatus Paceibacterota bacterium]|nr:hypothetical protein [Candidatus Paceibacterota bacterium]
MRRTPLTIVLLVALLLPALHANAAIAYKVEPLVIDLSAKARDIFTKTITVTNTGTQPVTIFPTVNNISVADGGTIEEFLSPSASDRTSSLASWIEIPRLGVNLKQGESKTFNVTFRLNPKPVPGTYHALIGFGYGRNQDEAQALVRAGRAPATMVTMDVESNRTEFLKLAGFVVDRFVTSANNEAASFTFKNPGEDPETPTGEIILYDGTGREVGSVPVNAENVSVPPGGEHTFTASVPTDGMFGKYKAYLSVEYGGSERATVQDTAFYYVMPLGKLIPSALAVLLAALLVSWFVHRRYLDEGDRDDHGVLTVHVRDTVSDAKEHDINLKR